MAGKSQYFKIAEDFSITELLCYGMSLGISSFAQKSRKNELVIRILEKDPQFLSDESKKYYFSKANSTLTYHENTSSINTSNFEQVKAFGHQKIKKEEVEQFVIKPEVKPDGAINVETLNLEDPESVARSENPSINTIEQILERLQTPKRHIFQQKLKYEPAHGIEAFIRSVESYAKANEISSSVKLISIAKAALNTSDDGLLLQDSLTSAEESDWTLFKQKLLSILGNPPDYYRDVFRSYRRGAQKLGLAMSKLTQAYKRGFLTGDQNLSENDKRHIMLQFIASLDNPLKGLVKAEEKSLTFEKIAERAAELERCFGAGFEPNSVASLLYPQGRVQLVNAVNEQKSTETVNLKMIELLDKLSKQSEKQHAEIMKMVANRPSNFNRENRGHRKPNRNGLPEDMKKKLNGFCLQAVKYGNCRRSNCTYKHEQIPDQVKKLFN